MSDIPENVFHSSLSAEEIELQLVGSVTGKKRYNLTTSEKALFRENIGAGEQSATFKIYGIYDTLEQMKEHLDHLPQIGEAYGIGLASPYTVYLYTYHDVEGEAVADWLEWGEIEYSTAAFDDEDVSSSKGWSSNKISNELAAKQNVLTFDTVPTADSANPVTSGGIKTYAEQKRLVFENTSIPVNRWSLNATYEDFPYCAAVDLSGVTAAMFPDVTWSLADAMSGNFAPVSETYAGGVYVWASEIPETAVTIPVINVWR